MFFGHKVGKIPAALWFVLVLTALLGAVLAAEVLVGLGVWSAVADPVAWNTPTLEAPPPLRTLETWGLALLALAAVLVTAIATGIRTLMRKLSY